MRPGGGTFALAPGATAQVQNENASFGMQVRGRYNIGEKNGYKLGNAFEANGWAAHTLNQYLSASMGVRWSRWGAVDGADPDLSTVRDPQHGRAQPER